MQAAIESERNRSQDCQESADARLATATAEASALIDTMSTLRSELSAAALARDSAAAHAQELEGNVHSMQAQLEQRSAADTGAEAALQRQVTATRAEAAQAQRDADAARAGEETALAREGQLADALADTQARLNSASASAEQFAHDLRSASARVESLESELADSQGRVDALQGEVADAKQEARRGARKTEASSDPHAEAALREKCAAKVRADGAPWCLPVPVANTWMTAVHRQTDSVGRSEQTA